MSDFRGSEWFAATYITPAIDPCDDCGDPATKISDETDRQWCDECHADHVAIMTRPCEQCGKPTFYEEPFEWLCYRCAFAENH